MDSTVFYFVSRKSIDETTFNFKDIDAHYMPVF